MSDTYSGPVRIYGQDGVFLTTGVAALEDDPDHASWKGLVQFLRGTAIAGKALLVELETTDGERGTAQLTPQGEIGDRATSGVAGLGIRPF